ncbi:MAG: flotillin family protein [Bradymonadaceae bacterium]
MSTVVLVLIGILILAAVAVPIAVTNLLVLCEPNEVLVFSGAGDGYQWYNAGRKMRIPLFHKVERLDVRNMVIELNVENAYSKGGIPLQVKGVANVKIGTREPLVNRAIERFLGRGRDQVMRIAKETLEGNLRGVLAALTPEEVNYDRVAFQKEITDEAEGDLASLGVELDSLKIQSVTDDEGYLDSIGRKQSAELLKKSRIAEAENRAEASVRDADNQLRKAKAKVEAQKEIAEADAKRRIVDAQTKAEAMVAEERSKIGAAVAKARANLDVQKARLEQVKRQLAADVIQPAQAEKAELEAEAEAEAAKVVEDGKANVEALRDLLETWTSAGEAARPLFLIQKFDAVMDAMMSTIEEVDIEKVTVIDSDVQKIDREGSVPMKAASGSEQIKETLGLDLPQMIQGLSAVGEGSVDFDASAGSSGDAE